ncbi:MAG: hypothetical protein IJN86_07675 [Clostridia bacterium]|nr:hypothetical protein [Clostridia bacterium]MBQ7048815.1 hypothetical protein [Clostridia bacterium]
MRILIYGTKEDCNGCISCLDDVAQLQYRHVEYISADDYDEFIKTLAETTSVIDLTIIISDGAEGMEAVMASKRASPEVPVVWISDDANFAIQSYRMGCTFFGVRPVSKEMMADAIQNYNKERLG